MSITIATVVAASEMQTKINQLTERAADLQWQLSEVLNQRDSDIAETVAAANERAEKAERERDEYRKQRDDEAYHHAACLSIAEGVPGWETFDAKHEAARAVQKLRKERDALAEKLRVATEALDKVANQQNAFPTRDDCEVLAGAALAKIRGDNG